MRALLLLLALVLTTAADRVQPRGDLRPIAFTATAVPLSATDPALDRVGRLKYLGGIDIRGADPRFGGLSGLRWASPGRLVAITDGGQWVTLATRERGDRLLGLEQVQVGIIRGPARDPLTGKAHADAEALEMGEEGLTVAFEMDARVWRYREVGGAARSEEFPDPEWLKSLPRNRGVEAMARLPGGWVYLSEAVGKDGANEGVIAPLGGLTRRHGRVKLRLPSGYVPTDADALDADHMLVVGRRFSIAAGVSAVIAKVPVDFAAQKLGEPAILATLSPPLSVDNMEGLAIAHEGGRVFVYICSDDNFSPIQRTLLLKFELLAE